MEVPLPRDNLRVFTSFAVISHLDRGFGYISIEQLFDITEQLMRHLLMAKLNAPIPSRDPVNTLKLPSPGFMINAELKKSDG